MQWSSSEGAPEPERMNCPQRGHISEIALRRKQTFENVGEKQGLFPRWRGGQPQGPDQPHNPRAGPSEKRKFGALVQKVLRISQQ